jgi:1,4-dihydroxy-2-naphthoate octaprenyltransferase
MGSQRSKLSLWVQVVRAFSFTASLIPVLVAASFAFYQEQQIAWPLLPLAALCAVLLHAGTNVVSEYYDFKKGVDKDYTFGSSRVLVEGLLPEREVLIGGCIFFAVGFLLGLILVAARGWPLLALGILGIGGGFFYSAYPIGYKYVGFGNVMVFLLMGPAMVAGAYYTLVGFLSKQALFVSLPIGLLVSAILTANNMRDIYYDRTAHVRTLENMFGHDFAKLEYICLICAAYLSVLFMIVVGILPLGSLAVFVSLPVALKVLQAAWHNAPENPKHIVNLDQQTAQLHFMFGMLLAISLVLSTLIA